MVNTKQYTDGILWSCASEICIILLTNVTPIKSIKIKKNYIACNRHSMNINDRMRFEINMASSGWD